MRLNGFLSLILFLVLCLAPLALSFNITLSQGAVPSPNSPIKITWIRTLDTDPTENLSLVLTDPNGQPTVKHVDQKGKGWGEQEMNVTIPGTYDAIAVDPDQHILATLQFVVPPPTSNGNTNAGADTAASSLSSSSAASSASFSDDTDSPSSATNEPTASTLSTHAKHSTTTSASDTGNSTTGSTTLASTSSTDASPLPTGTAGDNTNSTSLSSSSETPTGSSSSKPNLAVILGSVIGGVVFLAILVVLLLLCLRRRRSQNQEEGEDDRRISFHRDMMVRSPGPSLHAYASASRAASPSGYPGRAMSPYSTRAMSPAPVEGDGSPGSYTDLLAQASSFVAHSNSSSTQPFPPQSTDSFGTTNTATATQTGTTEGERPPLRRKNSNPFRDPELMNRLSMHFENASLASLPTSPSPVPTPVISSPPVPPIPADVNLNYSRPHPYTYASNIVGVRS